MYLEGLWAKGDGEYLHLCNLQREFFNIQSSQELYYPFITILFQSDSMDLSKFLKYTTNT